MFKWIKTVWRGTEPVEFASSFGIDESVSRLCAVTRRNTFLSQFDMNECVAGNVRTDRVALQRITPLFHNSFRLKFIGKFESNYGKAILRGRFVMSLFTRIFMAFWFGMLFLIGVFGCLALAASPGTSWILPLSCAGMIGLGLAVVRAGLWLSRDDPETLAQVIGKALQVNSYTTGKTSTPIKSTPTSRRPFVTRMAATLFALGGVFFIISAISGFQIVQSGAAYFTLAHDTSLVQREIIGLIGLAFAGIAYGFYRRNSITWRLGIGLVAIISISTLVLFVLHPESRLAEIDRRQAMQGNPVAENDLGVMYETGDGVPKSYTKAAKWYRLAAQAGDVHAQVNLGWLYQKGRGVPKSDAKGLYWYTLAAKHGDPTGEYDLGQAYYYGEGVPRSYAEAVKWYRRAADQGDPHGATDLGYAYSTGKGEPKDESKAVQWYRRAAAVGDVIAQNDLADDYQAGHGVQPDAVEAEKWYRRAARSGNERAAVQLAYLYATGAGAARNPKKAFEWYRAAAREGNLDAIDGVARAYLVGSGVSRNDIKAAKWYHKAAMFNDANAEYGLGLIDQHGIGVPHDLPRALYWYRRGAQRGSVDAEVALGVMYEVGAGTQLDYSKARKWFLLAAAHENPTAEVNLGMMDAKAQGVPQDLVKAYAWFDIAQTLSAPGTENYTVTKGAMALLRTHMPPKEIALSEQGAQAWLSAHPLHQVH